MLSMASEATWRAIKILLRRYVRRHGYADSGQRRQQTDGQNHHGDHDFNERETGLIRFAMRR